MVDITPTEFEIKKSESSTAATTQNAIGAIQEDSVENSIPQNSEKSIEKSKLSLSPEDEDIAPIGKYNIYGKDVTYLAMNKDGDIPGNYHGLGADIMKKIPRALQDPLFIVKQKTEGSPL